MPKKRASKFRAGEEVVLSRPARYIVKRVVSGPSGLFGSSAEYELAPSVDLVVASEGELRRNPIAEGELVKVPTLDTTGTVKEIIKSDGLFGGSKKYRIEFATPTGPKLAILPAHAIKRLNPVSDGADAGADARPVSEPCPTCGYAVRVPPEPLVPTRQRVVHPRVTCRRCGDSFRWMPNDD